MTNHKERAIAPKQGKRLHMDRSLRKMSRQIRRIFMEYPAKLIAAPGLSAKNARIWQANF
jgi:hypothetical protein